MTDDTENKNVTNPKEIVTNDTPQENTPQEKVEGEKRKKAQGEFKFPGILPVLTLRDVVIYPHMVIPLFVGRPKSLRALETCVKNNTPIFMAAQKDHKQENPKTEDLYQVGVIGQLLQVLKLPDDNLKVLVEGVCRGAAKRYMEDDDILRAEVDKIEENIPIDDVQPLIKIVNERFATYIRLNGKIPTEIIGALADVDDAGRLADVVAAHLALKIEEKQLVLATQDVKKRLELVADFVDREVKMLQVEESLKNKVKTQLDKTQREFFLHEKLKAIQEELGEMQEGKMQQFGEMDKLQKRIEEAGLSVEAKEKALSELNKLKMMPPMSAEGTVIRNYLDYLLDLPWQKKSVINKDLELAEKILEEDHYGLEKIKGRIIEYLAVQQRVEKIKGAILCLVGPPGVGKTSLGKSIARATGREFVRVSLGGVRDEAEIRGHRRTYIGSMPGKILQKLAKIKVRNPLFMLDEVDKMSMDFRGDPSAALLEVLDPEQNNTFSDHYLEVDYDLSDVLFIATANSLDIPPPLLDRMEIIRLAGYTEEEKLNIATRYLIPKQMRENGVKAEELVITKGALQEIIRYYTREAGVRNLEREIAKICRKVVKSILLKPVSKKIVVTQRNVEKYLGVREFHLGLAEKNDQIGQVHGLAWTEVGGELLTIEVAVVEGKGKAIYTGHLGEIMQESIQAALTVVRSRAAKLGIPHDFIEKKDLHVHVPEGATPKDGPSAGIGMCVALVSAITRIPVKATVAMTGEITLRGEVLPIGGLKEKLLAALRAGIKTVIIPEENLKDMKEMPKNISQHLEIKPVKWIDQVLEIALQRVPMPIATKKKVTKKSGKSALKIKTKAKPKGQAVAKMKALPKRVVSKKK